MTGHEQKGWTGYLRSREFRRTLLAILVFFGIFLLAVFLWLRLYTHHGQELELPDYRGVLYEQARQDAVKRKFRMSIQDSIHILGQRGGEIIKQNPAPGSLVKARRMIYVTVTRHSADKVLSARLPELYGKSYERKKKELEDHFEIKSRIADTRYDPGDAGQILEVRYKGQVIFDQRARDNTVEIEKGGYLEFVISSKSGGKVDVPDLVCKTYEEAEFLLVSLGLRAGDIVKDGSVTDVPSAYVIAQRPAPGGAMIDMESEVQLTVSAVKPIDCL